MGYKVMGLKISNMRNIDLVEVDFSGRNFVELTGKNGSGKSTILDSLFTAILGTKHFGRGFDGWRVIQSGEKKAMIKAIIGDRERQIEIRRSITKQEGDGEIGTGGSLAIIDSDGEKLGQEFLDRLLSEFTVDPVEFSRQPPKTQVETLKRLAGIDTTAFEALKKKASDERLLANREVARLKGKIAVPVDPCEVVSMDALLTQRREIETRNSDIRKTAEERAEKDRELSKLLEENQNITDQIGAAENALANLRVRATEKEKEISKAKEIAEAIIVKAEESTEAVDVMIADAGRLNEKASAYKAYLADKDAFDEAEKQAKEWDAAVKKADDDRRNAIKKSKLPFKNIEFDDDAGVLVEGVPFSQKSSAEKLRMSTRIGMEMSPELRVICIRDGALLDQESYQIVKELADRHDYQILVESVGEKQGDDQIVLRAGQVISAFEHVETTEQKVRGMDEKL